MFTVETRLKGTPLWSKLDTYPRRDMAETVVKAVNRGKYDARIAVQGESVPVSPPKSAAVWAITDEHVVKGFPTKPKKPGDKPGYMLFNVPIKVVEVRGCHWPQGSGAIKLSRSEKTLSATFPSGDKQSYTPTGARVFIMAKFGAEMGETLCNMLRVSA